MPRPYSQKFIDDVRNGDTRRVGIELAQQCIEANLPAKYVAVALGVSRATIHNWFRGSILRGQKIGVLPALSNKDAKAYIEDMIGMKI